MVQNADVLALTKSKGVSAKKKVANSFCILITRYSTYNGTFEVVKWKIIQKIVSQILAFFLKLIISSRLRRVKEVCT